MVTEGSSRAQPQDDAGADMAGADMRAENRRLLRMPLMWIAIALLLWAMWAIVNYGTLALTPSRRPAATAQASVTAAPADADPSHPPAEPAKPDAPQQSVGALAAAIIARQAAAGGGKPPAMPADPAIRALVEKGEGAVPACVACHGADGAGATEMARLAGLPAGYIVKQLDDFASGARVNEIMAPTAKALTAEQRQGVAAYYAALTAPSTAQPTQKGDLDRGAELALYGDWSKNVPACFSCHGEAGRGVAPAFPAIAGQQSQYMMAQFAAWDNGQRKNSALRIMDRIVKALSDADRRALADYLASLPPPYAPAKEAAR